MTPLKEIYNNNFFNSLNITLSDIEPEFNYKEFISIVKNDWEEKSLKERMSHICYSLNEYWDKFNPNFDFRSRVEILKKVAVKIKIKDGYPGLALIIFANYIEIFGLDDFDFSMSNLEFFTEFGSSEFAVRKFFLLDEKRSLEYFEKWSKSSNYHIRRLASEGLRPRLPWGIALKSLQNDPISIIPILENLKDDESEYVRRSVANNLNDISKDNQELVLNLSRKWLKNASKDRKKLVKHALRTLLKSSNKEALELFGFMNIKNPIESFDLQKLTINIPEVSAGNFLRKSEEFENHWNLNFNFSLFLDKNHKVRLEYVIYFLRKDGSYWPKVFQICEKSLPKGKYSFQKKHSFRPITTRKYYPGKHEIAILVNGVESKICEFYLKIN